MRRRSPFGASDSELGITVRPAGGRSLRCEKLLSDPIVAVISSGHPLAQHHRVTWKPLHELPYVSVNTESGVWAYSMRAATAAGVTLRPALEASSILSAVAFVRA